MKKILKVIVFAPLIAYLKFTVWGNERPWVLFSFIFSLTFGAVMLLGWSLEVKETKGEIHATLLEVAILISFFIGLLLTAINEWAKCYHTRYGS